MTGNDMGQPGEPNAAEDGRASLKQRFVPKKTKVVIDPERSVAGVFVLKFSEGTHVRLGPNGLTLDKEAITGHREEMHRLARLGIDPDTAGTELAGVIQILQRYRESHGFELGFAFREAGFVYSIDDPEADTPFRLKSELEQRAGEELADLDLYYVVFASDFRDLEVQQTFMNELHAFRIVEQVYAAVPAEGAQGPPTPDISTQQRYLGPAPTGLDAHYAWTWRGGHGENVRLIDVEYDWVTDHEDFPPTTQMFWGGRPAACPYVRVGSEHGTAVMGVVAAPANGYGITGFAPRVRYGLATICRPLDYVWAGMVATFSVEHLIGRAHNVVVANTIQSAADQLDPGDILLIEAHVPGPRTGRPCPPGAGCDTWEYVPMEYYQECFDVIRRATAQGVIVVEAAGNGTQNLDEPTYGGRFWDTRSASGSWEGRPHSGALLVGGSGPGNRMPNGTTNSSRRIDVHAWGEGVVTIGYGDGSATAPFESVRPVNRFYTTNFSGTSSAAAIVAGAVASLQGVRRAAGRPPLTPVSMRNLLVSTGTAQQGDASAVAARPIGRQPNLRAAIDSAVATGGDFSGTGAYTIRSKLNGKVLDIDISWFRGQDAGQRLVQFDPHGGLNQQFDVVEAGRGAFQLFPRHTRNQVLDVVGASIANGAGVQQWPRHSGANQLFLIEPVGGYYRIRVMHSGKALDVTAFSSENGVQIQQWDWLGGDNQLWEFLPVR